MSKVYKNISKGLFFIDLKVGGKAPLRPGQMIRTEFVIEEEAYKVLNSYLSLEDEPVFEEPAVEEPVVEELPNTATLPFTGEATIVPIPNAEPFTEDQIVELAQEVPPEVKEGSPTKFFSKKNKKK